MTLVEFLARVRSKTRIAQVASALYWHERYEDKSLMTASEIKAALTRSRLPRASAVNVPAVLLAGGSWVDTPENDAHGVKLWQLTETGRKEVRLLHGLPGEEPEIEHGVADLEKASAKISDPEVRAYVEEAVLALSVGALRASIVFVWVAAVAELEVRTWATGKKAVNAALLKLNQNAKALTKQDDLVTLKEVQLLQIAEDVGVLDKSEKMILDQALTTRNQSGHPNKYRPGVAKVKSHIEDIVGILWA